MHHHLVFGKEQVVTEKRISELKHKQRNKETIWIFVCCERKQTHLPRDGH